MRGANAQRNESSGSAPSDPKLSNAEIADSLVRLAQLLAHQKENPFKVKAYRRAANTLKTMSESVADLVYSGADLTEYSGIGSAISKSIQEMVQTGSLRQLETLRSRVAPEIAAITEYPRLDPKRVVRIYKKLNISSVAALKEKLEIGEIEEKFGARMEQHLRQAFADSHEMLLYNAEDVVIATEEFLLKKCGVIHTEVTGDYRRRVEVIAELSFLIETDDFPAVVEKFKHYGGRADLLSSSEDTALFKLSSGILLKIEDAERTKWGVALIVSTGSEAHLRKLDAPGVDLNKLVRTKDRYPDEATVYHKFDLPYIEPELREGYDEVTLAKRNKLPVLVSETDIRGELHAHTISSDGVNTIQEMASAAQDRKYEYIGITDHSQSLKIAGGVSEEDLWKQIRFIDKLNEKATGIRILKSAEVDILADGALDYSEDLLKELDYTVCSIHSRFGLGKAEQTERIMRAMDSRYFTILGHATGRLLLKRPGYEIEVERVIEHAKQNGCFFEINSSPDRLDLSAENARLARKAGVRIAINTDAHSTRELDYLELGVNQARRAGIAKEWILNCLPCPELRQVIKR